jgi:hypothetical protein
VPTKAHKAWACLRSERHFMASDRDEPLWSDGVQNTMCVDIQSEWLATVNRRQLVTDQFVDQAPMLARQKLFLIEKNR